MTTRGDARVNLALEGQGLATILNVFQQLPDASKDRVLAVVIELVAIARSSKGSELGFQSYEVDDPVHAVNDRVIQNLEDLRGMQGAGDEEAP